MHPLNQTALCG